MRLVALLTCLAFACATARQQVSGSDAPPAFPARVALAAPELELWMEGTHAIDPGEEARALAQSRTALAAALEGRGLDATAPEALLVVRARAIARTGERKDAQLWSAVGIVFVVVAIVVSAVLLSRSGSRSPRGGGARGVGPAPAFAPGARPVYFAPRPYVPAPVGFGFFVGLNVAVPAGPPPPYAGLPPAEAWLASRGWFDGDEVELQAELVDPATGAVRWHRTLRGGVDPRDAGAVAGLVDAALAGLPFGARQGALAAPSEPENP
ncbi:hypothetical protein [Anaeromyxobacter diazotrophicus]|uniref:DUF4136 domain-containing protein n=1 Tax=Anaeromyxobacter diazotrophicus TaxID=2590199 RepID=A0A7I9VMP2_9BACT|nr:hypothetical protein [Anaeromyxobacter diazotrophicus]GEJ57675.1 hypothetical protein AMYX_24160 [Anaeromyxobacter diazotrophicus]